MNETARCDLAHRDLLFDPSFIMTRRGQIWIERTSRIRSLPHYYPAALSASSLVEAEYSSPSHFPRRSIGYEDPRFGGALGALRPVGSGASIARDLLDGLNAGLLLLARRMFTVELLVAAGARVEIERADHRHHSELVSALANATDSDDLTDSLLRRVRLACVWSGSGPTLLVIDRGFHSRW